MLRVGASSYAFLTMFTVDFVNEAVARNLAQLEVGENLDSSVELLGPSLARHSAEAAPGQTSKVNAIPSNVTSVHVQDSLSSLWEKFTVQITGFSVSEALQSDWFTASLALGASLCFFARWISHRRGSARFDAQPCNEITLHRKLFDDASNGKLSRFGNDSRLWELAKLSLKWIVVAVASLVFVITALRCMDFSYVIIGCFGAIALAYDRQQNQLLKEGQRKLGIDSVA